MKRKLLFLVSLLVSTTMAWAEGSGTAQDPWISGGCTVTLSEGVLTVSGTGAMADYDPLNSNASPWHNSRAAITSVVINEGVTAIGDYAFYQFNNASFTSISMPGSVTRIGACAFQYCSRLASVTIPLKVTSIEEFAFSGCSELTSVTIGRNVASIGSGAFQACTNLATVNIWAISAPSLGEYVFDGCLGTIYYPVGATGFNEGKWASLEKRQAASNVWVSGNCIAMLVDGTLTISGPGAMGDNTGDAPWYASHEQITSVVVENDVTTICNRAFAGCSKLATVNIFAVSLTSGGEDTFEGCHESLAVNVPSGTVDNYQALWPDYESKIHAFTNIWASYQCLVTLVDGTLTVSGTGAMANYESPSNVPWKDSRVSVASVVVNKGVTHIGQHAFANSPNLAAVTIPSGVTSIGTTAFSRCYLMEADFTNQSGLSSADHWGATFCDRIVDGLCFKNNVLLNARKSITTATIDASTTSIAYEAFAGCTSLTTVTIPKNSLLTSIGEDAFRGCTSLTNFTSWTTAAPTLGNTTVFQDCSNSLTLSKLSFVQGYDTGGWPSTKANLASSQSGSLGENCTYEIYGNGFMYIGGTGAMPDFTSSSERPWFNPLNPDLVTSVFIGDGVTAIGEYTFSGCTPITHIAIPNSVTAIKSRAFNACQNMTSFKMSNSVKTIGEWAFYDCRSLTSFTIPASVTNIDYAAFANCRSLNTVNMAEGSQLQTIGLAAFFNCTGLTSFTIPASVTSIGREAFRDCTNITDVYCFPDPTNLTWNTGDQPDFKLDKETQCYVPKGYLAGYQSKFGETINVTFVGIDGACGDRLRWALNDDILTIYGTGAMANYETSSDVPWNANKGTINAVFVNNNVTSIAQQAFTGCNNLSIAVFTGTSQSAYPTGAFEGCSDDLIICVPTSAANTYKAGWPAYASRILGVDGTCGDQLLWALNEGTLTFYGSGAMADYDPNNHASPWNNSRADITSVVINEGVTHIGDFAFYQFNNASLTTIKIPNSVTSIGTHAFYSCSSLTTIKIPNSVTSIGIYAFNGCVGLTTMTIPSGVTSIGREAFYDCTNITDVYCYANPDNLTWSGYWDFKLDKATWCHVPAEYLATYFAKWNKGTTTDVRVTFVGNLLNVGTNNIAAGTLAGNWASYYNSRANVQAPEGVTVYIGKVDGSNLTLTKVPDRIINAGKGVVLKTATAGPVNMSLAATASSGDYTNNDLRGVDTQTTISTSEWAGKVIYTMAAVDGALGFYKYYDNVSSEKFTANTTLAAQKAFLPLDAVAAARGFAISFEDETTGISLTPNPSPNGEGSRYYNLSGQRVSKPTKGLYIVDGKKVIIK